MSRKTEGNAVIDIRDGKQTRLAINALKSRYAEELGRTVTTKEFLEYLFDLERKRIREVNQE